jgi:hypothetical protein
VAIRPLPGYPCPNEKGGYDWIGDVDGPVSYPTNGQQLNAIDFGFGGFEIVDTPGLSSDGVNEIIVTLGATTAGAFNLQPAPPAGMSAVTATTVTLRWFTGIARTTEVVATTNLSSKSIRLRISAV